MKQYLATGLALVGLAAAAVPALAFGHHKQACTAEEPCAPQLTLTWVEKTVTDYKTEWQEKKTESIVDTVEYQEKMRIEKRLVQQLQFVETQDTRTVMRLVPHPTVKDVTTFRMIPNQSCSTGGGCGSCKAGCAACGCHLSWSLVPVEDQIPATAYELKPVEEVVVITTAIVKMVEIPYEVREAVPVPKKLKVVRVERFPVTVPVCRTIRVPVYTPVCPLAAEPAVEKMPPPKDEGTKPKKETPK